MPSAAVVLGVLLFLLLHWVGPGKPARGRRTAVLFLVALAALPLVLAWIFPVHRAWPGSRTAQFSAIAQRAVQKMPDQPPPLILLVEGASHTTQAVDGELLEEELRRREIPAHVIQLSAGGANAFDRQAIFEQWMARMSQKEKQRLAAGRLILVQEVHMSYDLEPLSNFADATTMTSQGISAMSPKNAGRAWAALKDRRLDTPATGQRLGQHLLAHVFRLGALRMPEYWKPLVVPKAYVEREAGSEKAVIKRLLEHEDEMEEPDQPVLIPQWTEWRQDWMLRDAFAGLVDEVWCQAPPTLDKNLWSYEESWGEQHPGQPFFRGEEMVRQLWKAKFWEDRGHLSGKGARIYTVWLAERMAAQLKGHAP